MGPSPVAAIASALAPVWTGAFSLGHPYAEMCNGWLIGTHTPTSVWRPPLYNGCWLVPPSHISLVLHWASERSWPDIDPRLAQAMLVPRWRAFACYARAHILLRK